MNSTAASWSATSRSARATAGNTWPAVPPPAITTFTSAPSAPRASARDPGSPSRRGARARDAHEHADPDERHDERRAAERQQGQRHARDREEPRDGAQVDDRLQADPGRDAGREQPAERVGRLHRDPDARVEQHPEGDHHDEGAHEAELLADDREDEVAVRVRQVVPLLPAGAEADAEPSARSERDQPLDQLIPVAHPVGPRVQVGVDEARPAVRLAEDQRRRGGGPDAAGDREVPASAPPRRTSSGRPTRRGSRSCRGRAGGSPAARSRAPRARAGSRGARGRRACSTSSSGPWP